MFNKKVNSVYNLKNARAEKSTIHYSRYIAAWLKEVLKREDILVACNDMRIIFGDDFAAWLASEGLSDQEIMRTKVLATSGGVGLEASANDWIMTH